MWIEIIKIHGYDWEVLDYNRPYKVVGVRKTGVIVKNFWNSNTFIHKDDYKVLNERQS